MLFKLNVFALGLCMLIACKTIALPESSSLVADTYTGLLPCVDCAGIATQLSLKPNNSFSLGQRYLGKSSPRIEIDGYYAIQDGFVRLTPKLTSPGTVPTLFQLEGTNIRQLDLNGEQVSAYLADRYLLTEADLELEDGERHIWINSAKVPCTGVAAQSCMHVIRGHGQGKISPTHSDWQLFYGNIEGFNFQPGIITHLIVRETKLDPSQVPADASSIKYTLVRQLGSYGQATSNLHDIWALESLQGKKYQAQDGLEHPSLELNLTEMRSYGTDGCNRFSGEIRSAGTEKLTFGILASTKKMCMANMETAKGFLQALQNTRSYELEQGKLSLLDEAANIVMVLKKVD